MRDEMESELARSKTRRTMAPPPNYSQEYENSLELYYRINELVPVLSLPTELACTIFKMAAYEPPPFRTADTAVVDGRYARMEINITHVCRVWRSMALTYPGLWTTFAHDDRWSPRISIDCLAAYLVRSQSRPLELYFRLGAERRDDWVETLEHVVGHLHRVRRLSLRIEREWPADYLYSQIERRFAPELETLEIVTAGFETPLPSFRSTIFDQRKYHRPFFKWGMPKLRALRLDALTFEKCSPPQWDNMRTVTVQVERASDRRRIYDGCPWAAFISLLQCPHLVNLSLVGCMFERPNAVTQLEKPTVASKLVAFRCSDLTVASHMWRLVRAPRLELLIVKNMLLGEAVFPHVDDIPDTGLFPSLSTMILIDCLLGLTFPGPTQGVSDTFLLAKSTASATRLVVLQAESHGIGIMEQIVRTPEGLQLWPRLENIIFLYPMLEQDIKEQTKKGTGPNKYLTMVEQRSHNLKSPCRLGLHESHAGLWKERTPKSWARLIKKDLFLGAFTYADQQELIPWPVATVNSDFDATSEEHFVVPAWSERRLAWQA